MVFGSPGLVAGQHAYLSARPSHGETGPGEQDAILLAESVKAERLIIDALVDLQATNFHVSPGLIEVLLANDAKRRGAR